MSTESNKQLFRHFIQEVANRKNLEAIDTLVAPDVIEHEEVPGVPAGRDGVHFFFNEWIKGFPDGAVTLEKVVAEDDLVVGYQVWRGTQTGEFTGIPASGKRVEFKVIDLVRIANGKMVEHWAVTDNLALMQQIGAIPVPEPGPVNMN